MCQSLILNLDPCPETAVLINTAISDNAPTNFNKMGVIRPGFSAELDGIMNSSANAREWVASLEAREPSPEPVRRMSRLAGVTRARRAGEEAVRAAYIGSQ